VISVTAAARAGATDEARAASRAPAAAQSAPRTDPLLGSMALGSSHEPIAVTSESLVFDNRTHVLTYTGTVVVTQGDMKLESKTLTVALDDQADSRLKEVVASGEVHLSKGTRWATAGRAVFDQTTRTVVLTDNPVLHDDLNQVSGETVTVYLDEERSEVKGRVKTILHPPKNGTPGLGDHAP